ncbi:solute carrier family 22 member 7-like [Notothenia coriiceps]|uniref:Solute carrier family 22 member 7-like n=1 Tax=Notothenia coriiceps TaxID=8208 RepID=A0A6I9N273_9TELE|nr:PREDICTED: solute carrier family 22 member 7-like [Notothenia coriiceps]
MRKKECLSVVSCLCKQIFVCFSNSTDLFIIFLYHRFGRKNSLLVSYVTTSLFGFTSALSYNFIMFAVMRFLTGFGIAGISITSIVLCIEWVDIKHRTKVGVLMSLDWSIFTALLPVVAYFVNDWRVLTATATSPLILAMISWWWLPESARWLISNGKSLSNVILVENENRKYSYLDLVRTPRMRRLAILTAIVWFGVASTYYGIIFNVSGFGLNIYITQLIYGLIELPAKALIYFAMNKVGRRSSQGGALVLTGLCIFCNMFVPQDMGLFRTAVGALGKMFAEASFTCVYLYTTELYPTVMRQNGLGYSSFMGRIGVSISPLIILLEEVWGHLPSTIFSLVAFTGGLTCYLLPETQNIRLPETIEEVEHPRRRSISASDEKSQP